MARLANWTPAHKILTSQRGKVLQENLTVSVRSTDERFMPTRRNPRPADSRLPAPHERHRQPLLEVIRYQLTGSS